LKGVRQSPKKPVVVYAGTRAMIGAPLQIPATESTLPNPTDLYGVNKLAAELYGSVTHVCTVFHLFQFDLQTRTVVGIK
jgi:nucleoside-diphosphate-sugar epimerase